MKTHTPFFLLLSATFFLSFLLSSSLFAYGEGCTYGTSSYGESCSTSSSDQNSGDIGPEDIELSIGISEGAKDVDIVDNNGNSVSDPGVALSAIEYAFSESNTSGILGTPTEKIRLNNRTSEKAWTVSIAPTDGTNAVWSDGNGNTIDCNDPNGNGQLSINPALAKVYKADGTEVSTTTDVNNETVNIPVTLGNNLSFEEGVVESITLYSSNSNAESFTRYDIEGIEINQSIPAKTPSAEYLLNLTLTAI